MTSITCSSVARGEYLRQIGAQPPVNVQCRNNTSDQFHSIRGTCALMNPPKEGGCAWGGAPLCAPGGAPILRTAWNPP